MVGAWHGRPREKDPGSLEILEVREFVEKLLFFPHPLRGVGGHEGVVAKGCSKDD